MTAYVALLRAVNVGSAQLPMADLKALCEAAGFEAVRTYIASGNALFRSDLSEAEVKSRLEAALAGYFKADMPVMVRTAGEMAQICAANPFPEAKGSAVAAIFLDAPPPPDALGEVRNQADDERLQIVGREIWVAYGAAGMGRTKLKIPAAAGGTARNANTVAKLAELAAAL
ncbi:DUF1697 domain-containing protein [Phenylobacterium deserti]|uniref:DUF1697 domain-containing protein n=1 Tax=Phenylobacterium deserti TaxID=1914756 RepID=A0A328AQ51_9CAUL|nr:DUF1697 domain-containing protein [Phenylobacterium deserti]RAK56441.1 hypothetical protein DJ018_00170 [Phenylobacterium deserti]